MIQNQFGTKIKHFRLDNARDYFNQILGSYFQKEGIVHESSCLTTPQQNGVAKRKNRHLLECSRALLFKQNVPKTYWGEAVLTILSVYVDGIIVTGNDEVEKEALERCLAKEFEIKDFGRLKYFLGIVVARSRRAIFFSQ